MADERHCAHRGVAITDPTTRVLHGGAAYCRANCQAAISTARG